MKKLIAICLAAVMAISAGFAEMYFSDRVFEIGADINVALTQNAVKPIDFFHKEVVLDLDEIYEGIKDTSFVFQTQTTDGAFLSINGKHFGMGINAFVDATADFNISDGLFKLLADGNTLDEEINSSLNIGIEAYAEASVPIRLKIGSLIINATPSAFLPLVYMPNPQASVKALMSSDGNITLGANAAFDLFSNVDTSKLFGTDMNFLGFDSITNDLTSEENVKRYLDDLGIDISATVGWEFSPKFSLCAYGRCPIIPGKLNYKMSGNASYTAKVNPVLNSVLSDDENAEILGLPEDGPTFSGLIHESVEEKVNRPARAGIEFAFLPFENTRTVFYGSVGLATRDPFDVNTFDYANWKDKTYLEYNAYIDFRPLYVLGLYVGSSYQKQIFTQTLGLTLSIHVIHIDCRISSSGSDFIDSFYLKGLKGTVLCRVGF